MIWLKSSATAVGYKRDFSTIDRTGRWSGASRLRSWAIDFYLTGNCRGEISGKVIRFKNSRFADEDLAGQVLGDVESPQIGDASLISFDPHPHLVPHPYIEWFSMRKNHYRIELVPEDAWIATEAEIAEIDAASRDIRDRLAPQYGSKSRSADESEWV